MSHTNIWFSALLASCVLLVAPAFADGTVSLAIATKPAAPALFKDDQGNIHPLNPQQNKLTAVHFWATWCSPCIAELPEIDAMQTAHKDLKILALSLDGDGSMDKVKQFYTDHQIVHLDPYIDFGMASFKATHSAGLPTTIFIDADGKEIARAEGPLDWKSKEVTGFIDEHLK